MNVGSACYAVSLMLSLAVFAFVIYGQTLDLSKAMDIFLLSIALFTGVFVRNKFYNSFMILLVLYLFHDLYYYSIRYGLTDKSPTQINNEGVIFNIFALAGWFLTATYVLWQIGNRLARWKASLPVNPE